MTRREFLQRNTLVAGGLLLAPPLLASAWTDQWRAESAVRLVIAYALGHGAEYVDARVGHCALTGHGKDFGSVSLLESELLGARICLAGEWRHVVLHDLSERGLRRQLPQVLQASTATKRQRPDWISATFDEETLLASGDSDPATKSALHAAWMRYSEQRPLPSGSGDLLFCDVLLEN